MGGFNRIVWCTAASPHFTTAVKKQSLIEEKYLTQPTEPAAFAFRFVHGQSDIEWSLNDVRIIEITPGYRKAVDAFIKEEWAGPVIVSKGCIWDTSILPGFVAIDDDNNICGMVTYRFEGDECEIITLNSLKEKQGIGTGLINAVFKTAKDNQCRRLWLITTNDNAYAIRFYQRFGFTLREVHINALEKSRKLKPSIPLIGMDNIPLQHEFEFEIIL